MGIRPYWGGARHAHTHTHTHTEKNARGRGPPGPPRQLGRDKQPSAHLLPRGAPPAGDGVARAALDGDARGRGAADARPAADAAAPPRERGPRALAALAGRRGGARAPRQRVVGLNAAGAGATGGCHAAVAVAAAAAVADDPAALLPHAASHVVRAALRRHGLAGRRLRVGRGAPAAAARADDLRRHRHARRHGRRRRHRRPRGRGGGELQLRRPSPAAWRPGGGATPAAAPPSASPPSPPSRVAAAGAAATPPSPAAARRPAACACACAPPAAAPAAPAAAAPAAIAPATAASPSPSTRAMQAAYACRAAPPPRQRPFTAGAEHPARGRQAPSRPAPPGVPTPVTAEEAAELAARMKLVELALHHSHTVVGDPATDRPASACGGAHVSSGGGHYWYAGGAGGHGARVGLSELYKVGKAIGEGAFGFVRVAQQRLSKELVAVKTFEKNRLRDASARRRLDNEIRVLQRVRHPHIVRLFETFESPKRIHLVMEYVSHGTLYRHLKKHKKLAEPEARRLFRQLVGALACGADGRRRRHRRGGRLGC